MSLESKIDALIVTIERLTTVMATINVKVPAEAPAAPPVAAAAPQAPPPAAPPAAAAMPTPPAWGPPAAAPAASAPAQHPFTKQQDIYDYCQAVYQANNAMGPVLGQILQKLTPSGEASALQPTQYGEFYAAVEAAKRG